MKCRCIEDFHVEFNDVVFRKDKIYDYLIGSVDNYTVKLDFGGWSIITSKDGFNRNFVDVNKDRKKKLEKINLYELQS